MQKQRQGSGIKGTFQFIRNQRWSRYSPYSSPTLVLKKLRYREMTHFFFYPQPTLFELKDLMINCNAARLCIFFPKCSHSLYHIRKVMCFFSLFLFFSFLKENFRSIFTSSALSSFRLYLRGGPGTVGWLSFHFSSDLLLSWLPRLPEFFFVSMREIFPWSF